MYRVKLILSFVTVAAFLLAVGVAGVDAGALKGKKLLVDTVINAGEVNDGVNTITPSMAMTGDTVKVELFVEDGGGNKTNSLDAKFAARLGEIMIEQGWQIVAASKEVYVLQLKVGPDAVQVGALPAADIPANGYIGTVNIVAGVDAVEGVSFYVKSAVIGLADGSLDSLDVSGAIVTVRTPPSVVVSGDMLMEGNMVDIPVDGSASVDVGLQDAASDSPSVSWTVTTEGEGTLAILDAEGNEVVLDSMMMASGPTSLTLQVSGGDLTVTVRANVDGQDTEPVVTTFTQLQPPPPTIGIEFVHGELMEGNRVSIPVGGSVSVDVGLKEVTSDSPSVSWTVTTDTVGTGTLTVLDAEGNEVVLDSMMMASGPTSLTLQVSGGDLTVTVRANVDGVDSEPATITFTQSRPSVVGSGDMLMDGNMAQLPGAGGSVSVDVGLENAPDEPTVSWTVATEGGGTLTILDGEGNMLDPDDQMMVSGPTSLTLKVTGGDLQVTVKANVNGVDTEAVKFTFTQLNPAELASFDASLQDNQVVLNWSTVSQTNNAGWRITRSVDGENFEAVGDFVQGAGTADALMDYTFEDKELPGVDKVYYRLEQVDLDGSISQSNVIEVLLGARMPLPTEFAVNVYPNPFNPSTTISYELPKASPVTVVIYDVLGQQIRQLISQHNSAGRYQVQWDARDNQGRGVASGVYIAKINAGTSTLSQKMLLLK